MIMFSGFNIIMMSNNIKLQKGLTLIEILISLLLGAFLIGGVLQIFISSRQTYRVQETLSRLQENGRFAMDFIGRDVRMAGYRACVSRTPPTTFIVATNGAVNANPALDVPDTITLQWSEAACTSGVLRTEAYTTAISAATNLRELRRGGATNPLIDGVENIQITYGVDTNGDGSPDYYGPSNAVTMSQAVSVRVSLLVVSLDNNVTSAPVQYTYNGGVYTPPAGDLRLRRVFTSTFALRNKLS
jgi:type IV pilus assembly protein PilW